ncbi:MAG: tail fiber domain-containing protein, partial [Bacteroidales bacterium]|nr:tail fiber domain-containing protein [Bacteroidales bacterium]
NPNPQTNANGLVSLEIGSGIPITGTMAAINWAAGPYFLKTETDPTGGTTYSVVGTSQLLSVPYALLARTATEVVDNSITSAKILDGTIATADLGDNSVTSAKIVDGTIANADISPTAAIAAGKLAVTNNNLLIGNASNQGSLFAPGSAGQVLTISSGSPSWQSPAGGDWALTGNAGTTDGTHFIGTTDNVALNFKVNNQKAGRIASNGPVFLGYQAGNSNTATSNTGVGRQALFLNTTGDWNTANGYQALTLNTTGNENTANGHSALRNNTIGNNNTANGHSALRFNTTGNSNTASGQNALYSNKGNSRSTAIGLAAMYYADDRTSGRFTYNTAIGCSALHGSTTASDNTGQYNTAIGDQALFSNTTGDYNTAIGDRALYSNTTGNNNTANGTGALYSNKANSRSTAIGLTAMYYADDRTSGRFTYNTAIGCAALHGSTTASDNTGQYNTAIGDQALFSNITGDGNTATGRVALYYNTTGGDNTALGAGAGFGITTGSNNTAIGYNAQVPSSTANNQVRIGNTSVSNASVQVAWTIISDSRWKSNIQKSNLGLDFIKQLNPVFYTRKDVETKDGETKILDTTTNLKTEYGFIAQELESTLNKFGAANNGIISKDDDGNYGVRYNDLLAPMVKAIQEQQEMINNLLKRIEELEKGKKIEN